MFLHFNSFPKRAQSWWAWCGRARATRGRRGGTARSVSDQRGCPRHRHRGRPAAPLDLQTEVTPARAIPQIPKGTVC